MFETSVRSRDEPGVCFLLEAFHPVINGAAVQIMLLGQRLVRSGANVTIITRKIQPQHLSFELIEGSRVFRVKPAVGLKRSGKYWMLLPALVTLWKERRRYDVIVVCDLKVLGMLGILAAWLLRKACVLRAESCGEMDGSYATQFSNTPSGLKHRLIKGAVRLRNVVLMRADVFLSISSVITEEFRRAGVSPARIAEIPNGVDLSSFAPGNPGDRRAAREALGIDCGKKYFIYTGRLARGKGLEYLLRVWKRLTAQHADIHLFLVGAGQGYSLSCEDELRDFAAANGLESSVTFTGNVSNVNQYLRAADVFVIPSQSEACSLSLLEAMACGLPCITTAVGGIMDMIDPDINGVSVPYGDENALFNAMSDLLGNGEKARRLGLRAREKTLEKFHIEDISGQYLHLLESLAKPAAP